MDEIILKRIADYCKGEISKEDFEKLGEWLSENPDNRAVLKSYVELYKKGREISFLENWDREASWQRLSRRLENSRKERAGRLRRLVRRFAATAAACLLFVGGVYYFYDNREVEKRPYGLAMIQPGSTKAVLELPNGSEIALEDTSAFYMQEQGTVVRQDSGRTLVYEKRGAQEKAVYHTLRVPVGGEYHLVLSDGTRVWLNSASEFHYPTRFDGDIREVSFSGEVYFEVAKDSLRPFVVRAGDVRVKVLGTSFNVSAYPDEERVVATLVEGSVALETESEDVVLRPGEQAVWDCASGKVEVNEVDASVCVSWVKGRFEFEDLSLEEITRQLSRWYDVSFEFVEPSCARRHFTGGLWRDMQLLEFLKIVEQTTNVRFLRIDEKRIVVRSD